MPTFGARCRATFHNVSSSAWFEAGDPLGSEVVSVVMACDVSERLTRAGSYGNGRLIRTGSKGIAAALCPTKARCTRSAHDHATTLHDAATSVILVYEPTALELSLLVGDDALAPRAATVLDTFETLVVSLASVLRPRGGVLASGDVQREGRGGRVVLAQIAHHRFAPQALMELVDPRAFEGEDDAADRSLLGALHVTPLPPCASRTSRDGLLVLRFLDAPLEREVAAEATERRCAWLSQILGRRG
jgi:hypothetical protein